MGCGYWTSLGQTDPKWIRSRQSHKREKREYRRVSSLGKPVRYPIVKFSGILLKSGRQRSIDSCWHGNLSYQPIILRNFTSPPSLQGTGEDRRFSDRIGRTDGIIVPPPPDLMTVRMSPAPKICGLKAGNYTRTRVRLDALGSLLGSVFSSFGRCRRS